jgi:hypothetical protein
MFPAPLLDAMLTTTPNYLVEGLANSLCEEHLAITLPCTVPVTRNPIAMNSRNPYVADVERPIVPLLLSTPEGDNDEEFGGCSGGIL